MTESRATALLVATPDRDPADLAERLRNRLPSVDIRIWPDLGDPRDIGFALAWQPPEPLFNGLANLRAVSSLGAGVDALIDRSDLPERVAVGRLAGPMLAADMAAYLVVMVVGHWKRLDALTADEHAHRWRPRAPSPPLPATLSPIHLVAPLTRPRQRPTTIYVDEDERAPTLPPLYNATIEQS